MTMIRYCCCFTALVAVSTLAFTGSAGAEDKKAAPAPAAAPAAPPAGMMKPAAAPAMKPAAPAPAAAPAAGAPAAAPAAPATAPPMPAPSKELESFMKGFEGNWKCETKFAPGAMGPG